MRGGDDFLKLGKQDKSSRQERKREKALAGTQASELVATYGVRVAKRKVSALICVQSAAGRRPLPLARRLGQVSGWLAHSRAEEPPPGSRARPQTRRRGRRKRLRTWPAPRLGGRGAQGSPDPPGDQAAGRQAPRASHQKARGAKQMDRAEEGWVKARRGRPGEPALRPRARAGTGARVARRGGKGMGAGWGQPFPRR